MKFFLVVTLIIEDILTSEEKRNKLPFPISTDFFPIRKNEVQINEKYDYSGSAKRQKSLCSLLNVKIEEKNVPSQSSLSFLCRLPADLLGHIIHCYLDMIVPASM